MATQPPHLETTGPKNTTRLLLACIALYAIASLLGVWYAVIPLSITAPQNNVFLGFDGSESTPDGNTLFRWAGADASLSGTAARSGWAVAQLTAIAADPMAQLDLSLHAHPLATFAVQSTGFRRYQILVHLPQASTDRQSYIVHTSPTVQRDGRTLGIAIAAFRILPTRGVIPGAPPVSWLVAVLLSTLVLASGATRVHWSLRTAGLACLGCAAPWMAALAGIVPVHTALLAAGAAVISIAAALRAARGGMPRVLAAERWLRRRWATQPGWGTAFQWLCLVGTIVVISRLWPIYASHGWWGSIGFVGCLAVYPLAYGLHGRRTQIPVWAVAGAAGLSTIALMVVYWIIYQRQIDGALMSDLPFHMDDARRLMLGKVLVRYTVWVNGHAEVTTQYGNRLVSIPHPWFHWSIGAIAWLMRDPYYHRALPVTLMLYQLASLGILGVVVRGISGARVSWAWIWLVSLLISVVAAVYLPDVNPMIYRGQGSVTIFHNATTIVAKPLTWIALLAALALIDPRPSQRPWLVVVLAIGSMVAATLAKPNGALAIVPALWIGVALRWLVGTRIPRRSAWLLGPSVAALVVLLLQSTVRSNGGSDFGVAWMTAARGSSPSPWVSVIQLTAFPLLTILLTPYLWRSRVMQTATLAFVIAVVQYFVFIEPANVSANNFAWGMRIIVPLLYAGALGVLLRDAGTAQPNPLRTHLLALVLTAHVLSGVLYLVQLLTTASYL